jgi:hypothetical protein
MSLLSINDFKPKRKTTRSRDKGQMCDAVDKVSALPTFFGKPCSDLRFVAFKILTQKPLNQKIQPKKSNKKTNKKPTRKVQPKKNKQKIQHKKKSCKFQTSKTPTQTTPIQQYYYNGEAVSNNPGKDKRRTAGQYHN